MTAGACFPAESRWSKDTQSGLPIRQITSHESIHHHPFFFVPAYDRDMRRLFFISWRTGLPQVFFEDRASGQLVQVTDKSNLAEWSLIPSSDGKYIYYTAGAGAYRADVETFREEQLADFGTAEMREKGMIGAAMGTTALSASGRWWAIPVKNRAITRFVLIDTFNGSSSVILERDTIGHPQFCPDDDDLILYAGPLTDRVWVTDRSGAKNRRLYERENTLQWVTHEIWVPGTRSVSFVDWPRGTRLIDSAAGNASWITRFPAWHAAPDDHGSEFVCDSNFPDQGIHVFGLENGESQARFICNSNASSEGAHWAGAFPYNEGPVNVQARQHTHPHPRFSPDKKMILFTSDKSGFSQIYEVMLDDKCT